MFWITKNRLKKSLEANGLIRDAIAMGITDKYIHEENIQIADFELQLLGRSLNWAVPNLNYNFESDLDEVENEEFKKRLKGDEDQIFKKGLEILNSNPSTERLISHYVAYEIHLVSTLFPQDGEKKYPGMLRMKKFLFQSTEKEPDTQSQDFMENYKNLFEKFNAEYGKYGKALKKETVDSLFSLI